jgi:hypothetical protein
MLFPSCLCVCVSDINCWKPEPIFKKLFLGVVILSDTVSIDSNEYGAADGMTIDWGNRITRSKPAPVPFLHLETCMTWIGFEIGTPPFFSHIHIPRRRDSAVGIATGHGLENREVRTRIFSSPRRPDRLWGPPSLLFNGYYRFFPWG